MSGSSEKSSTGSSGSEASSNEKDFTNVLLDVGSGHMKVGFCGDDSPRAIFKTIIGRPTKTSVELISSSSDDAPRVFVGEDASSSSAVLDITNPVTDGCIKSIEDFSHIINHAITTELRANPRDCRVLLTEAANNPEKNRMELFDLMFTRFKVPAAQIQIQAVLSLYSSGRTTGLVFDSGDGVSHTVPVFKGYGVPQAVVASRNAGRHFSDRVITCLRTYNDIDFGNLGNKYEIVKPLKESICRIALNFEEEMKKMDDGSISPVSYEFKDGTVVDCLKVVIEPGEILFSPKDYGMNEPGVEDILSKTLGKLNIQMKKDVYGHTVLSGGNTCTADFEPRFTSVYKECVPKNSINAVKVIVPPDRAVSVFCGGSILGSLSSFNDRWITLKEYEEQGKDAIIKKKLF